MILLTDGTVMCLTNDSSGTVSQEGNTWDLLTPDSTGSYQNGTWFQLPPMHDTRLYCATWVMPDGNVYVAGGEYGTGAGKGEIFNTTTQTWTSATGVPKGWAIYDGSSENLYDGTILQGVVETSSFQIIDNLLYHPTTNSFGAAASCFKSHDECSWVKLRDSSVMSVDLESMTSERYIPQLKKWVKDSSLKNYIMDFKTEETGPAFLLPNGKLFFLSDSTFTAIYTPSGDTSKGTWAQGPAMPIANGIQLGCTDAPAAIMPNGNILCAMGPAQSYNSPVYLYEYNYISNTFTQISAPGGGDTISTFAFATNMLDLPDGSVLYGFQGSNIYYQYVPSVPPIASGKPVIDTIMGTCPNFKITGKLFNGISEGSAYGDDWQCASNYPIVRLSKGGNVYYAKTTNWNRVGAVMTDSLMDTTSFLIPPMPAGIYAVQVIANGNASNPYTLNLTCTTVGMANIAKGHNGITVSPNPSNGVFTVEVKSEELKVKSIEVYNELGQIVFSQFLIRNSQFVIDLKDEPSGVYYYRVSTGNGALLGSGKLVLEK